jgi:hypothetical protein
MKDDLPPEEPTTTLQLSELTDVSLLAAGDPLFSQFVPDDYKAYIRFKICTAFPNVIGPEMHGRYFGFHPQVLVNSYQSLIDQQTNLGHALKLYGAYRDRIQGFVKGVSVANLTRNMGRIEIPGSVEEAPFLDCIAVVWKMAEGNKEMLGKHITAQQKTNVSIEVGSTMADLLVYNPTDRSIHEMAAAMVQWPGLITQNKKTGLQIGKVDGVQFAFAAGGAAGKVPFRGVGYTPNPAESKTAKIIDLSASGGAGDEEVAFAAISISDWEAGETVAWAPVLYGQDAGRGTVTEVVYQGSQTRHGLTKSGSLSDPLLVIKVHGKKLEVLRHSSSVKKG